MGDAIGTGVLIASGGLSVPSKLLVAIVLATSAGAITYVWKRAVAKR